MKDITIKEILNITNGTLVSGDELLVCNNFSKDTRDINTNDVYIGIKGEKFDGNNFYKDAFDNGALACILDKTTKIDKSYKNKTIVLVDNTIKALQDIAKYKRNMYDIPVVAITGSVGKTSTKDIIASVLNQKYKVLKTEGNYNNHIGLPLTILKLKDHDALVVEMGMNRLGEIEVLSNIAKPTIAVITNVGTAHIGNLGSRENILKAKLEICSGLSENGIVLINNDNDMLHNYKDKINNIVKTIGINNNSDYMATNIVEEIFQSNFLVNNNKININIGGEVFIYNALMAYAVGNILNIDNNSINKGISEFKLSPHRLETKKTKNGALIIDDTYNANYDSMSNAIKLLGKTKGKKIAVLGSMLELGDYEKEIHTKIGDEVVKNNLDILITVGSEAIYIKEEAVRNGFDEQNTYSFDYEYQTYDLLKEIISKDSIVLVKGSHGINLDKVVEEIIK